MPMIVPSGRSSRASDKVDSSPWRMISSAATADRDGGRAAEHRDTSLTPLFLLVNYCRLLLSARPSDFLRFLRAPSQPPPGRHSRHPPTSFLEQDNSLNLPLSKINPLVKSFAGVVPGVSLDRSVFRFFHLPRTESLPPA